MTDNKMTPEEFVERWLPGFKERWIKSFGCPPTSKTITYEACPPEKFQMRFHWFARKAFPEALEAFARHVWDRACREQRIECSNALFYAREEFGVLSLVKEYQTISTAPAPEFKPTEKK